MYEKGRKDYAASKIYTQLIFIQQINYNEITITLFISVFSVEF